MNCALFCSSFPKIEQCHCPIWRNQHRCDWSEVALVGTNGVGCITLDSGTAESWEKRTQLSVYVRLSSVVCFKSNYLVKTDLCIQYLRVLMDDTCDGRWWTTKAWSFLVVSRSAGLSTKTDTSSNCSLLIKLTSRWDRSLYLYIYLSLFASWHVLNDLVRPVLHLALNKHFNCL